MRYLLIFLVVLLAVWRWRAARPQGIAKRQQKSPLADRALPMVACAQCGVHVPADDAIKGARGVYCSAAHRQSLEP